jgi:tRNA threonylcarbamoyl adenosine modification protein (Sua5/YciO/YrdC/YwlC family)
LSSIGLYDVEKVSKQIRDGRVGVLPTDTLYGLVCDAKNIAAVKRLYSLKNRDKKPGTVIASSVEQLVELGLKQRYLKPVAQYWPGPISVVIPCVFELPYLHMGVGSLAVRVVGDEKLRKLVEATGPLLTTSANKPGKPESTNIAMALNYFGDSADFYIDGGDYSNRLPSTVIRVVDDMVEVLRLGAVKINDKGELSNDI